jgi:uncharacterized protein YcbK (DUF882 family)
MMRSRAWRCWPRSVLRALEVALLISLVDGIGAAQEAPRSRPLRVGAARPVIPAGYSATVREWHTPARGQKIARGADGRPLLVLHAMYVRETVSLPAMTDDGGFAASDLDRAAHALRDPKTGNAYPIEPRTLDVLYRIQCHFQATEIRVMSAYRTPNEHSSQGLHGRGRAVDFVVPGAADQDVARFARGVGFVGVGIYPDGSFVHVDVRERSYFWVDRSGPGHRSRERGMLLDVAQRSDAAALARGERPPRSPEMGDDVDRYLRAKPATTSAPSEDEDDQ